MKNSTRYLTQGAVLAAAYVVLTLLQNLLLPGTVSQAVQFRLAEALCVFALLTPAAIPGLTLGCFLFNITNAGALPLDFLIGSMATMLSCMLMYWLRGIRLWKLPVVSLLMPALCNGLLVGWELSIYIDGVPTALNMLYVALGEAAVLLTLGSALYLALSAKKLDRLFGR